MEQTNLTTRKGCKSTSICLAPKRYNISIPGWPLSNIREHRDAKRRLEAAQCTPQ